MSINKAQFIIWTATAITIIGVILNAEKSSYCWVFYLVGNTGFLVYFIPKKEWSMVILNCFYVCLNIWGLFRWIQ